MKKNKISMIAAIGKNRELGKDNKLLWHIKEDLQRFKQITSGHAVIMGRKTFESLGRPLPNRLNIIVTRDKNYDVSIHHNSKTEIVVINSLKKALRQAQGKQKNDRCEAISPDRCTGTEIFIIGGGQIYEQGIKYADKLYLTIVEDSPGADTFFPDYSEFKKIIYERIGESEGYKYTFIELER